MLTLTPAYGRDYKSLAEAKKDFFAGKDFVIHSPFAPSTYISIRDLRKDAPTQIKMRYSNLRKVGLFTYNPADFEDSIIGRLP